MGLNAHLTFCSKSPLLHHISDNLPRMVDPAEMDACKTGNKLQNAVFLLVVMRSFLISFFCLVPEIAGAKDFLSPGSAA